MAKLTVVTYFCRPMSTTQFYPLTISSIERLTAESVSIAFDIPSQLKQEFDFIPGQYLTLKATIGGEEVRRSYSICSSASESQLKVGVKKVPSGLFSTMANTTLSVGDVLDVMSPMGSFHSPIGSGHYVAMAAGSGITPVLSIIKSGLESTTDSRFTLIYGNRSSETIMFKSQIEALLAEYGNRLNVVHRLSAGEMPGAENGRIDGISLNSWNGKLYDVQDVEMFFLCGPEEMISTATTVLSNQGVIKERIKFELFTVPVAMVSENAPADEAPMEEFTGTSRITVIIDDEEVSFELKADGESILDAGLNAGADLPFACKGGVCCTCRAKVTKGKAHMTQNFSLDDKEIEEGYVLTCQSHPDTAELVVDYDA